MGRGTRGGVWVALACMLALLSGCTKSGSPAAGKSGTGPAPGPAVSAPVTLTVLSEQNGWMDLMVSAYQDRYPDRRVQLIVQEGEWDAWNQRRTELAREGKADLLLAWLEQDVPAGLLQPVDPFVQRSGLDLQPYGPALDRWRVEGRLYGLPTEARPSALLYSRAAFKAAGLPEPEAGWTWDQFREAARQLTRGEGEQKVWGFFTLFPDRLLQQWVEGRTGKPWWEAEEKELAEGLQFLSGLVYTDRSMPPVPPLENLATDLDLRNGNLAMTAPAPVSLHSYLRGNDKYGVMLPPVHPGGRPTLQVAAPLYGMAAGTKHPDEAWHLLQFLAGPEGAAVSAGFGALPAYSTPEAEQAWFGAVPPPVPQSAGLFRAERIYAPLPGTVGAQLTRPLRAMVNRALSGAATPEQALSEYMAVVRSVRPGP